MLYKHIDMNVVTQSCLAGAFLLETRISYVASMICSLIGVVLVLISAVMKQYQKVGRCPYIHIRLIV